MLKEYFEGVRARCIERKLEPAVIPNFTKMPIDELNKIREDYRETLTIINSFMTSFVEKNKGIPIFVTVTDNKGNFIEYLGDQSMEGTIVHQVGLDIGVQFREEVAGISSIIAAIELRIPAQTIGKDHFHHFLQGAACYSVPLFVEGSLIGTVSIMTFIDYAHPMILTSLMTIVERIEREIELLEENSYLNKMNEMILEQSNTGFIVVEENGIVSKVNPKAKALLPNVIENVTNISSLEAFQKTYEKYKDGERIQAKELVLSNSKICLVDFLPFLGGSLIQLHDISEYKEAEYYIQNAEKLSILGQLAAGVAHEIKNPLTTLKGFIQLLQETKEDEPYVKIMLSEIERINEITNEFLVLSRPTVQSKDWHNAKCLIGEVDLLLSSFGIEKNVTLVKHIEDTPSIYCDGNQLKQVIINIVKNSVEAVDKNGEIMITVRPYDKSHILIRFEDSGSGFPSHILSNVGQPFITTKKNGSGLGIMVCKRIVETIHQGELNIYNNEDVGAVVDVILPIGSKEQ